jgi:DNA-binding transcriptional regulator PaaX
MKLSPLFESLILIEHKKTITTGDLYGIMSPRSTKGVIGKMEAMSLIKKDNSHIQLSRKGHHYLNNILANLHEPIIKWDGLWTVVSFSIPEKKRSQRDKLRRFIESIGMKPLLNSIWISPLNLSLGITEYIKIHGLEDQVLIIRTRRLGGIKIENVLNLWEFENHRKKLEEFIRYSSLPIEKGDDAGLEMKRRIFSFAIILENQPKVPIDIFPKNWPYLRARMAYKKLRLRIS